MKTPPIVSPQEWEAARVEVLVEEKKLTRARDALAARRRRMPWMAVEKEYRFDGPDGTVSLPGLFEGRRSYRLPRLLRARRHHVPTGGRRLPGTCLRGLLIPRRPGRAPRPPERAGHDARLRFARPPGRNPGPEGAHGLGTDPVVHDHRRLRQKDFGVDQWHGTNAFIRDGQRITRTYFVNSRGAEAMGSTWSYLDITALGRQEQWEDRRRAIRRPHRTRGGTTTTRTVRPRNRGPLVTTLVKPSLSKMRKRIEQRASASCAARWTRARTWGAVMLGTGRVPPSWPARA